MSKIKLSRWDAADQLKDEKDCVLYLKAVMEEADDDEKMIAAALGDIARARGMMQVARDSGLAREALYRALSPNGNPSFATVLKVAKALGLKFSVARVPDPLQTLVADMQTPKARAAGNALFKAKGADLGKAAIAGARKRG